MRVPRLLSRAPVGKLGGALAVPGILQGAPPPPIAAGFFLACSWTWGIAMLLPALLLRDYGIWGWVVFAAPNVAGATAVGFAGAQRCAVVLERHGALCRAFSLVVIALHAFVICWLAGAFARWGLVLGAALALALLLAGARTWRAWTWAAVLLYAGSVALLGWHFASAAPIATVAPPRFGLLELALFGIASCSGFLVCPFLDATLLATATTMPDRRRSRATFLFGFALLFLAALAVAPLYRHALAPLFALDAAAQSAPAVQPAMASFPLLLYLTLQGTFTLLLHLRFATALGERERPRPLLPLGALAAGALLGLIASTYPAPSSLEMTVGEIGYRGFLVLFGVSFPLALLGSILGRRASTSSRAARALLALTVVAASAAGALFFVTQRPVAALAAVLVIAAGTGALLFAVYALRAKRGPRPAK